MDARKKVKLTIEVTLKDIELLEDFWSTIPLCNKHKGFSIKAKPTPERELMTMYYECDDCEKVHGAEVNAARRIEGKLAEQYWKKEKED